MHSLNKSRLYGFAPNLMIYNGDAVWTLAYNVVAARWILTINIRFLMLHIVYNNFVKKMQSLFEQRGFYL